MQNVVTYDTVIEVSNPDLKLKPGMTANASIITAQRSGVLKIPNSALRFKPPEAATNQTVVARLLAKIGVGKETKATATNAVPVAKPGDTNKVEEVAANGAPPLTGNEPPEELMRRVREMRERGEEAAAGNSRQAARIISKRRVATARRRGGRRFTRRRWRRFAPAFGAAFVAHHLRARHERAGRRRRAGNRPQPVRVKTGISDGAYTEITDGLKEGDTIITAVKLPQAQAAAPPAGTSPFGGGGGGFRGGR